MLGRRATAMVTVALLSGLLLAACGSSQPSAQTLARSAVRGFDEAPVKTIQGSFVDGVIPVSLKVTVGPHGDISGSGTFNHFPVAYVQKSKSTFVEGTQYWAWERLSNWQSWNGLGSTWVKTDPSWDPATSAFRLGARATGLVAALDSDAGHVNVGASPGLHGRPVDQFLDGPVTYDVTTTAPHRLISVRDNSERVGSTVLGNARFSIAYGGAPPQRTPSTGQYVDPNDPGTMPAYYNVTGLTHNCQRNDACALTATVENAAGAPVGQGVVTITEYDWPGFTTPLASCQAAIPAIGYHASATVGCTASNPGLAEWFDAGLSVDPKATISSNPPYWT